jgi:hypothetical protein
MKIAFATDCLVFDRTLPNGFRAERKILESTWDWYPLRVALVLGAVWHAKMESRRRLPRPAKREVYAAVADAICAMLHRLGDMERYIDYDGLPAERERTADWVMQAGLVRVVEDIEKWVESEVPRYRVACWAAQWEALRAACTALESHGEPGDSALFSAVLDIEALERVGSEHSPGRRHAGVLDLCQKAAKLFAQRPHTDFMVEPLRQLATHLQAVTDEYEVRYTLVTPGEVEPVVGQGAAEGSA